MGSMCLAACPHRIGQSTTQHFRPRSQRPYIVVFLDRWYGCPCDGRVLFFSTVKYRRSIFEFRIHHTGHPGVQTRRPLSCRSSSLRPTLFALTRQLLSSSRFILLHACPRNSSWVEVFFRMRLGLGLSTEFTEPCRIHQLDCSVRYELCMNV